MKFKAGDKFNRLTLIEFKNSRWICKCNCGKIISVRSSCLSNNNTKSCGCLNLEKLKERGAILSNKRIKYSPEIASAKRIYNNYKYRDKNFNLEFEEFLKITKNNCYYCGVAPSKVYNYFIKAKKSSNKSKELGNYIYNGLDRIDSTKYHTIDNIVPCCDICNRAKRELPQDIFMNKIQNFKINRIPIIVVDKKPIPEGSLGNSIKSVFYNYSDGDLTIEEFYYLSQEYCYYCGGFPKNIFNRAKIDKKSSASAKLLGDFFYNGLDRIDNKLKHNKNNVVPCCKYCNFAKSNISFENFCSWIERINKINNS